MYNSIICTETFVRIRIT